jgi:peptidoglycan hydrolase-like protein with peptidoglycan-binding domain
MLNQIGRLVAGMLVVGMAIPVIASAETTNGNMSMEAQTQIQTLLSQIKALQEQLKNIIASSTPPKGWSNATGTGQWMPPGQIGKMACITLTRNLRQGDQGDDVKSLQQLLKEDGESGFTSSPTGFFGPLTARAMMKFQMRNGIASSTDGTVGPLTRGFFERHCGKGLDGMQGKMPGDSMSMAVRGTISANNTSSITIQTNGGPLIVHITGSTTIKIFVGTSTPTIGTISDLTIGKNVVAEGKRNSDGSMLARMIGVGDNVPMMKMENDQHKGPQGIMPILNGPQRSPGLNGGPQNW